MVSYNKKWFMVKSWWGGGDWGTPLKYFMVIPKNFNKNEFLNQSWKL